MQKYKKGANIIILDDCKDCGICVLLIHFCKNTFCHVKSSTIIYNCIKMERSENNIYILSTIETNKNVSVKI